MNKDYAVHWTIAAIATVVWFWGDLLHIPAGAISLAASVVPGILAHAVAYDPSPSQVLPSTTPTDPTQPTGA